MKKYFLKLMSWLLHSLIHQVMWYFWLFIENPFSLLWSIFFSRKPFPLVSLSLVIHESINLDTSGKPPSWIVLSISLHELNWINWLLKIWWWLFSKKKLFCSCKRILILQKILEVFWRIYLNIIVNVNFFSDLKFEYYCVHYPEILLQVSLK